MNKYKELLNYFQINLPSNQPVNTFSFVTLDNIHDAIIKVGVKMDKPINFYITKAKQIALNDISLSKNRAVILAANIDYFVKNTPEFVIGLYGFTEEELTVVLEILMGIPKYQSTISVRKYNALLPEIYQKLI